jgi:hypothetical protein
MGRATQDERTDIWTALPGRIKSFDPARQTATVEVLYKPRLNGQPTAMPDLVEVPVVFPRGGGSALTFPIKAGDGVQLQFQSRDMGNWYASGEASEAGSARMHDLSDAVAIPGLNHSGKVLTNFDNSTIAMQSEDGTKRISLDPQTGKVQIGTAGGDDLLKIVRDLIAAYRAHTNNALPLDSPHVAAADALQARIEAMMG